MEFICLKREKEEIVVLARAVHDEDRKEGKSFYAVGVNEKGELLRLQSIRSRYGERESEFGKLDSLEVTFTRPEHGLCWENREVLGHRNLHKPLKKRKLGELFLPLTSSLEELNEEGAGLGIVRPELLDVEIRVRDTEFYDRQRYFELLRETLEKRGMDENENGDRVRSGSRSRSGSENRSGIPVELNYTFRCKGEPDCRGHSALLADPDLVEFVRGLVRKNRRKGEKEEESGFIEKKLRERFFDFMREKELFFIVARNSVFRAWMVIGLFYLEKDRKQKKLIEFCGSPDPAPFFTPA